MPDLLTRIQEVIKWSALGPAAFADEIGVARPVMSHILSARNKASLEVVQKIMGRYSELSPTWLLSGNGEMLISIDGTFDSKNQDQEKKTPETQNDTLLTIMQEEEKVQKSERRFDESTRGRKPEGRTLVKVVLLFSDGSFESYDPS